MQIKLSEILCTEPQREHGNIEELKKSIKTEGLLQPIVINQDKQLICGRRRYEAVKMLGWEKIEAHQIKTTDDVDKLSKAIAENIIRKQLSWTEECNAKEELDRLMRVKFGETDKYSHPKATSNNDVGWSSRKTAELLNESEGGIRQDIQLSKAIKEYPQLAKVKTKTGALVELHKIKDREKIKTLVTPKGKFDVIVIDPPWEGLYESNGRRCGAIYPTMTLEQIENIILPMNDDCVIWFWTINKYLHEAFHILDRWNLVYKNTFTWVKPQMGLGEWGRTQTEHILLATRGKPIVDFRNTKNVISADRKGHSEKPHEFYEMAAKCCLAKTRLDYFARKKREGWEIYGTEKF